ncbi:alpha/beta fold hydrolase [Hoyosella rhizosphaerae]|uniref:alpha/beta fold hydrolase n=1 Tax=Hoyosella rhizosphaerae TaxID=1755582 RepID=UPI00243498B5|nr:alpha/beta hydrolase [Hoyosella rhizosphaerae]
MISSDIPTRTGIAPTSPVRLAYEEFGPEDGPAILLVMGFGAQMIMWPTELCLTLAREGFRVIRFDNRDIGLSTKFEGIRVEGSLVARLARSQLGLPSSVPYTLVDMAADSRKLLDYLGIAKAHIVGASMGGMITQIFAAENPQRALSASIIFSSTNEKFLPPPTPPALLALVGPAPRNASLDELVNHAAKNFKVLGGPAHPRSDDELRDLARSLLTRSYYPAGMVRQFAAVIGTGSLKRFAQRITAPTAVIHGTADPLLRPACGKAVARAVPGARLFLIDGMGHDLPESVLPHISSVVLDNIARS